MSEVLTKIQTRRSIRSYKSDMIPKEILEKIITAGTYAEDGSLTMGNLMLAAHELGVGSCWIHRAREVFEQPEWQEWLRTLGIEEECVGVGHCALGYVDGEYPTEPLRRENRVFYVE